MRGQEGWALGYSWLSYECKILGQSRGGRTPLLLENSAVSQLVQTSFYSLYYLFYSDWGHCQHLSQYKDWKPTGLDAHPFTFARSGIRATSMTTKRSYCPLNLFRLKENYRCLFNHRQKLSVFFNWPWYDEKLNDAGYQVTDVIPISPGLFQIQSLLWWCDCEQDYPYYYSVWRQIMWAGN